MGLPAWFWIIAIGALVAASCSIVGCFSCCAVWPCWAMPSRTRAARHRARFLITKSRNSIFMLIGAAVLGLVTAFWCKYFRRAGACVAMPPSA
jgi:manganese/zinc/iron transport system permease protein